MSVVKAADAPEIKSVLDSKLRLKGRKLQTTAGKDLGEIDDLQFDERSGAVLGYELSGGLSRRASRSCPRRRPWSSART